ncbi:MAG: SusC/RagA family TonB-linked outer membrane protein [Rhodospirillaceae bacterium]|uniref:SusC/RagA family TonB-linked outer membrane protein n=1 Tax=Roseivirga pacifica TaxID=1267423 RepID=UPI000C464D73|nr:TonB-dependent receptor [Roseivirga pacifica]MBH98219.1 SusC/RagA family TonB-linked outer membrane protein [Rhodospirillaceae bacterium]
MKRNLLTCFMLAFMLISSAVFAQNRTVSGKVTGADDGLPLPQVTVLLKGTTSGIPTNFDGEYTLSVPAEGGTLVFRYLGYVTQEVEIGNRSVINIQLAPDVQSLGEVVVTGYGVEQKRDITGAIAQIKAEEIENLPLQSFDRAVQGRIAGVQVQASSGAPGASMNFLIRGQSSLANNTPLYIVDGVQIISGSIAGQSSNNALSGLNPDDIETIEVLKDAAAAAIYGAQAANGVVIITTKKGSQNGTRLEVVFQGGFVESLELYDMMNAQEFAQIKEASYINAGLEPSASWALYGNPNDPSTLNNYDWADNMFRTGSMYNASARLSGGDEKTQFYISASSERQEGQIILSAFDRQTLRTNVTHQATDKLSIGTNIAITNQHQFGAIEGGNFVNGPFQAAFTSQPNSPAFDENGNYNPYPVAAPGSHLFGYNIIEGVNKERRENYVGMITANMNLTYKIAPAFTWTALGGLNWADSQSINERPSTIPAFASTGGSTFVDNRRQLNWNVNSTLNFNKSFGDHNVSALVGFEMYRSNFNQQTATGRGFSNPALTLLNDAATPFAVGGTKTYNTRAGAFVRGNYNYKNKYYFNGTLRRDGSSRFGAQNRVGTFYSVGASWRLIEEDFMSSQSTFDDLKLRLSYGVLGNSNGIGNFSAVPSFSGSGQYLGQGGQVLNLANDQLTWERSEQYNIGLDFAFLDSRLSGAVDFFRNDTGDQLFSTPLPIESGFSGITSNVGAVRAEGIEIELQSTNVDAGNFRWTSQFNITFQNNEVLELPGGVDTLGANTLIVGQPISYFWGVEYVGINPANGREMYRNRGGDIIYGNASVDDGYILGSGIADYFGGLTNTFSYKGLSLSVFFQFQGGNESVNQDLYNLDDYGNGQNNQLRRNLNYWQQPGDVTTSGRPINGGVTDGFGSGSVSRIISDATYVRLKQVSLSYDLPQAFVSRIGLNGVNVFVNGINLLTFTKFDGIDPEVAARNSDLGGSTYGVFPVGKQFTGGISLSF